jgi:transcriptional regulator with XRE-family HTH domain
MMSRSVMRSGAAGLFGVAEVRTVATRPSPLGQSRRLGLMLRKMREHNGLTLEQVAERLECSQSKISRIETGHNSVNSRDVRDLLAIYGVSGPDADDLIAMARAARQRGWWHPYNNVLVSAYVGLETDAREIRTYEHQVMPGLLQTSQYAEAMWRSARPDLNDEDIATRVRVRMERQTLLNRRDNPVKLQAVLDQAVLSRPVGGDAIMIAQLWRLHEAATTMPNVTIQVLPFAVGAHAAVDGTFAILDFAEPADARMVYAENATGGLFLDKVEELKTYVTIFERVQKQALSPEESAALIARLAEEPTWVTTRSSP